MDFIVANLYYFLTKKRKILGEELESKQNEKQTIEQTNETNIKIQTEKLNELLVNYF